MTGFAQAAGSCGTTRWSWDIKTVNGKGLDIRLRAPPGFDALEIDARKRIGARLVRGSCQASLSVSREQTAGRPRVNADLLAELMRAVADIPRPASVGGATLDGLLAVRGVIEANDDPVAGSDDTARLHAACAAGLDAALDALVAMRSAEGAALSPVLAARLTAIARLTAQADGAPERQPAAIMERLDRSIAMLGDRHSLDPARLHQEALILAARSDVREELDRLMAHVEASRELLAAGGPCGRRLDFLAQELGREASTFCAKVNDTTLTTIGLELRVEIEQFREQVQNIE